MYIPKDKIGCMYRGLVTESMQCSFEGVCVGTHKSP